MNQFNNFLCFLHFLKERLCLICHCKKSIVYNKLKDSSFSIGFLFKFAIFHFIILCNILQLMRPFEKFYFTSTKHQRFLKISMNLTEEKLFHQIIYDNLHMFFLIYYAHQKKSYDFPDNSINFHK